ncbi:MAG: hypothetical protein M1396_05370 [Chloroflexi bacterium]|nr:hypothetical protein [Chloroflexota bacterium]
MVPVNGRFSGLKMPHPHPLSSKLERGFSSARAAAHRHEVWSVILPLTPPALASAVIFFTPQRYFVQCLAVTGLKG